MSHVPLALQILVSFLLIGAAAQDLWSRTISNYWSAAILILFLIAYTLNAINAPILSNIIHFALALSAGMLLFSLGWFGGGDAKLYAAIALWFSLSAGLYLFVSVAMAGFFLAVIHLVYRMFQAKETRARAIREGKIAYGVAIAVGAIYALPRVII